MINSKAAFYAHVEESIHALVDGQDYWVSGRRGHVIHNVCANGFVICKGIKPRQRELGPVQLVPRLETLRTKRRWRARGQLVW